MKSLRFLLAVLLLSSCLRLGAQSAVGIFPNQGDVGNVLHPGKASYEKATGTYLLTGSGSNIWFTKDEFHYLYTRIKGDFILQARGHLVGKGVEMHRKFGWMVRSSLDTSSPMACVAEHGDGLTSLQFRKAQGANVEEVRSTLTGADILQLERRGNRYIMSVARDGQPFVTSEVSDLDLGDQVYVGLFICSHNKDVSEQVSLDNVRLIVPAAANFVPYHDYIGSDIEILDVHSGSRKIIHQDPGSIQAPNWTRDGKDLIYNSSGLLYRFDLASRTPSLINTGTVRKNNNDHVLSFDGSMLAISSASDDGKYNSLVFTVPLAGGQPTQLTPIGPSYSHGWSPDGRYIVFTGQRNGEFDIYRIPSTGGPEVRLTTAPGLDDGPEYSPDGKYIYFNSVRSGSMQIWRMKADGSDQEQLTSDGFHNWFPHVSPDGKWIVFISFLQEEVKADDHPFYKHVYLRMMPVPGAHVSRGPGPGMREGPGADSGSGSGSGVWPRVIAYVYGGQGTINTPSWSPDSKKIAFVSNTNLMIK